MIDHVTTDLVRETLIVTLELALPILAAGIVIGLVISVLQSITSIQDQALTFVPKIVVMILIAVALMPWIIHRLSEFCIRLLSLA